MDLLGEVLRHLVEALLPQDGDEVLVGEELAKTPGRSPGAHGGAWSPGSSRSFCGEGGESGAPPRARRRRYPVARMEATSRVRSSGVIAAGSKRSCMAASGRGRGAGSRAGAVGAGDRGRRCRGPAQGGTHDGLRATRPVRRLVFRTARRRAARPYLLHTGNGRETPEGQPIPVSATLCLPTPWKIPHRRSRWRSSLPTESGSAGLRVRWFATKLLPTTSNRKSGWRPSRLPLAQGAPLAAGSPRPCGTTSSTADARRADAGFVRKR